jgi:hypothetical protein
MFTHALHADSAKAPTSMVAVRPAGAQSHVQRKKGACGCGGGCPTCAAAIQPKLVINAPGDSFEQEADRIADQVTRADAPADSITPVGASVQRQCACGGSCPDCAAEMDGTVQRKGEGGVGIAPPSVHRTLRRAGQPLDASTLSHMESRFRRSFDHVRIHTDPDAASSARDVGALAYTVGPNIVFDSGRYAPGTSAGKRLLAHELTHTIQQSSAQQLQRAVDFTTSFTNLTLTQGAGATIGATTFQYNDAVFSVDANVTANGDTEAELKDWDVGILQDELSGWERYYWTRNNADGRGRLVEKKFLVGSTPRRDQAPGAATVWDADSEHTDLSGVAAAAVGPRFRAATTVTTSDTPNGPDDLDGANVSGMDASDGTKNIHTFDSGGRFQTWISAHNKVTGDFRHLRWINWNYQHQLGFTGSGGTLAVGTERWQLGHFSQVPSAGDAPLLAGTTANTAYNDNANWSFRRVNGWT